MPVEAIRVACVRKRKTIGGGLVGWCTWFGGVRLDGLRVARASRGRRRLYWLPVEAMSAACEKEKVQ